MNRTKASIIGLVALAGFLSVSFTVYSFVREVKKEKLPFLGQVHDFTLVNEEGEPYQLGQLKDKVWIASFFFTTCSDICPLMIRNLAALNRSFQGVDDIQLVSITVNPEYDTAATLKSFATKEKAGDNWVFLTGDRQAITDLALKSFKFGHKDEPVFHSSYFALVDRNGFIRAYYEGTQKEAVNQLFKDTALLLKE